MLWSFSLLMTIALVEPDWGRDAYSPANVWESWPETRFVEIAAPCLTHDDLQSEIGRLEALHGDLLSVKPVGLSVEERSISLIELGSGPRNVLLWSQMHGDEPSATPALLDIAHLLASNAQHEPARSILRELTLLVVPMLNPDGAERYSRRNVLGIDLNRDALHLESPEARLLKQLRDEYEPVMGFNLHDQDRRIMAGDTGKLATISLLSVAGDAAGTVTPGRERTMRAATSLVRALRAVADIGIGRYDEDWNPRAFGDNVTKWGTPVLLIESGGLPPGSDLRDLTRLNVVGIVHALAGLARNDLLDYDVDTYRELPRNSRGAWADVVFRNASLVRMGGRYGTGSSNVFSDDSAVSTYTADLAFDVMRSDRDLAECRERIGGSGGRSRVVDLGDVSNRTPGRLHEARGTTLLPMLRVGLEGWRSRRTLDESGLRRLASLGVGEVVWDPGRSRMADALDWVATAVADREGVPDVRVVTELPPGLQLVKVTKNLDGSPPATLADVMSRLGVSSVGEWLASAQRLGLGSRASFLELNGGPSPDSGLAGVWLDGRPLRP